MKLPFLNREREQARLRQAFESPDGTFCCLYGRRRCGKSRLLRELLPQPAGVYHVGDEREASLQRASVAAAMAARIPGFADATYPEWEALLRRWWQDAPDGSVLALDEFPYLVTASPELPSLLQKMIDEGASRRVHLVVCGSSQRMMQGLILDASAPLYGRAREIIRIEPLGAGWVPHALGTRDWGEAVNAFAVWGGIPRYWELARDHGSLWQAVQNLVLDPQGVLHNEPQRLLADDLRDTAQAASILALVGQGCHRLSEIAGRLGKPATSLSRPMQRLLQLGLLARDVPFGEHARAGKSALYKVGDPFLAFWFRFLEPNRSRLGAGAVQAVAREIRAGFPLHVAAVWEQLARDAVPRLALHGQEWRPASRWWGTGTDRRPLEVDLVAESADRRSLLVGEVKLRTDARDRSRVEAQLKEKAARLPFASRYAEIVCAVFAGSCSGEQASSDALVTAAAVIPALV